MFSRRHLSSLLLLSGSQRRSGSYQVSRAQREAACDWPESGSEADEAEAAGAGAGAAPDHGQGASLEPAGADFNRNNAKRLKKLRSVSFVSRLVYLRHQSHCYHLSDHHRRLGPRPARNKPLTSHPDTANTTTTTTTTTAADTTTDLNNNQPPQSDGVTLCSLGVGTTFGASVTPGKSHCVSVVTNEECTLLRVRRADFQEIFNEQSHLIKDVDSSPFNSLATLNRSISVAAAAAAAGPAAQQDSHQHQKCMLVARQRASGRGRSARLRPASPPQPNGPPDCNGSAGPARRPSLAAGSQPRPQPADQQFQLAHQLGSTKLAEPAQPPGPLDEPHQGDASEFRPDPDQAQVADDDDDDGLANLDSLDSDELADQLMRAGWVLRTLMLAQSPELIQNRRPAAACQQQVSRATSRSAANPSGQQQQQHQHQARLSTSAGGLQRRQLGPGQGGSQLALGAASSASSSSLISTKSAASAAGRKVANYVASSFMRTAAGSAINQLGAARHQSAGRPEPGPGAGNNAANEARPGHEPDRQPSSAELNQGPGSGSAGANPTTSGPELSRCMVGRQMVDWLLQSSQLNSSSARFVTSRLQAISMWQVLLEQAVVFAVPERQAHKQPPSDLQRQQPPARFLDEPDAHYKFWFDREQQPADDGGPTGEQPAPAGRPRKSDVELASDSLWWALKLLSRLAPDACFRLILSKRPSERSAEEVDIIFEELQHLKALSHLTNSVKKQLAACVEAEHHWRQNTVIFNQGDAGHSWYIILRGSVNVVIVGKGVVCTLHDGDDFGKLALVNDAPRAATIVTNEPNCYFLRVDKHNFNTILRDVEANTVRLKEHGKEVLILQKVATKESPQSGQQQASQSVQHQQQQQLELAGHQQQVASELSQHHHQHQLHQLHQPAGAHAAPATQAPSSGSLASSLMSVQAASQSSGAGQAAPQVALGGASAAAGGGSALKYMVMAGTAEKMLEHLLETRIDGQSQIGPLHLGKSGLFQHDQVAAYVQNNAGDNFLEDFILTHRIFMPTGNLCNELLKQYQCQQQARQLELDQQQQQQQVNETANGSAHLDGDYLVAKKRRVVKFVRLWMLITREHFFQQNQIQAFLTTLYQKVKLDAQRFSSLQAELNAVARIYDLHLEENLDSRHRGVQRWVDDIYGNMLPIRRLTGSASLQQAGQQQQQPATLQEPEQQVSQEHFLALLQQRRFEHKLSTIQAQDELVFRVYCADHTFTTLKARFDEQAAQIKQLAARNLRLEDKELILVHVKSNGERIIYNDLETNISTCLSVNGRLFVCPLDHIDAISPLPDQDPFQEVYQSALGPSRQPLDAWGAAANNNNNNGPGEPAPGPQQHQQHQVAPANGQPGPEPSQGAAVSSHLLHAAPTNYADIKLQMSLSVGKLEEFSSRDVAYCLSQLAWSLLNNMHEFELIYTVFGRHNFKQITANLNVFLRHFNEIQYWVVTQICLSQSLSKREKVLRKFIKIAAHCKELQNLNAFFAIIMGLSNMAVARLTQTWERLPSKLKRLFSQFESQIDPSRNHRRYRIFMSKLEPPIIPFMPLFLKDMTFAHEGNKTYLENGLINFEKMQMVAQTLRTLRYCKSRPLKLDSSACKFKGSIRSIELFFRDLKIIDNQRTLTQMSHQLEHRKT